MLDVVGLLEAQEVRADAMFDGKDNTRFGSRRGDDVTDRVVRRRWSAADKARVVADSLAPGMGALEAARRWQVGRRQVYAWRREAQAGLLPMLTELSGARRSEPAFVPIVAEPSPPAAVSSAEPATTTASVIEVEIAGAVVRVSPGMNGGLLAAVLRAVRLSAVSA